MEEENLTTDSGTDESYSDGANQGNIEINNSQGEENATNTSGFEIPEEYKDKGWAKVFGDKSGDDLKAAFFKSYDSAQTTIGKRVEDFLANNDLKQLGNYEEIKKTLTSQLMPEYTTPEDIKDYGLTNIIAEELGEDAVYNAESIEAFANVFKENGISQAQGKEIMKSYVDFQVKEFEKFTNADELENNINQMFKSNPSQRTVCESLIKEFLPSEDQKFIQQTMPNVVVEMFYKVAKGLVDKYDYKENNSARNSSTMRMSQADKNNEYERITKELEELARRPHSQQEKQQLLNQLMSVYR